MSSTIALIAVPALVVWISFDLRFRFWRAQVREIVREEMRAPVAADNDIGAYAERILTRFDPALGKTDQEAPRPLRGRPGSGGRSVKVEV